MSETETVPETPTPEKRGRGPTRPEVRFADLVGEVQSLDTDEREGFLDALATNDLPAAIRARAKTEETELRASVKAIEARIATLRARAELVEEANKLPGYLRAALPAAINAKEE